MILSPNGNPVEPQCSCCGTCCRKGGPALHRQDEGLIKDGVLRAQDMCSFRAGELVRDTGEGHVVPLPQELVKIAAPRNARPDDWTCRFLTAQNTCFLYGRHPSECQTLYCQAPERLMKMSGEGRLDRKAVCSLLNAPAWWGELMDAHEERCAYDKLTALAEAMESKEDARREFLEAVEYDRAFRDLVVEKRAALPEELDFLFGRPLLRTIIMFGIDARTAPDGGITLVQVSRPGSI